MNDENYFSSDNADVPPVTAGSTVVIQLKDGGYIDAEGNNHRIRVEPVLMTVHAADFCGREPDDNIPEGETLPVDPHVHTICTDCIGSWALDYYITLPDTPDSLGLTN